MKYAAFALAAVAAAGTVSAQSNGAKWVPLNSQQAKQQQGQAMPAPTVVVAPQPGTAVTAQPATSQPVTAQTASVARVLPAGTLISLTPLEELSSKHIKEGERYQFEVVADVTEKGVVVIPRGSPATGIVTMQTGRGIVGKSGKFEVTFESVTANGVVFPLSGIHRQEGKGNTVGALLGSMWISGHSAVMLPGEVVTAFTKQPTAY